VSLYTEADRQIRNEIEAEAKRLEAERSKRQQEHIDRTLDEELLVAPAEKRNALRDAYKTEKANRTPEQVALLEEHPSIGNISPGSLYLYAQQRGRRATDIERFADDLEQQAINRLKEQEVVSELPDDREAIRSLIVRLDPDAHQEIQRYRQAAKVCRAEDAKTELAQMLDAIKAVKKTAPKERFLRVLTEPANHTPTTHLFIRGDHNQPGVVLPPDELTIVKPDTDRIIPENDSAVPTSGRRLAYARHLTNGKHPLLARVFMNRVWMHHMGRGIVDTLGDFGQLGGRPTHPELLDWLADEFMRGGWTLKRMHRMIMLSRTYRQVADRTEELDATDPDNRLYARMSMRRLESEAIRDAMLVASDSMLHQLHGPPVPVKEDSVGQIVLGTEMLDGERKPNGTDESFDGMFRRSVYVQVRRSRPLASLETFDIASLTPNCVQRSVSNVAPQALLLMNSQFVIDHAERFADDLLRESQTTPERLSQAWLRSFGQPIENSVLA
jgi:hypothetical protein